MNRIVLFAAVIVGALALGGAVSASQGTSAPLYRNTGHTCGTGATDTGDWAGHFYAQVDNDTIHGTVSLVGGAGSSEYTIVLVQNHPCVSRTVGTLLTNGHGDGSLEFTAIVSPGATVVWVSTSHNTHKLASTTVSVG